MNSIFEQAYKGYLNIKDNSEDLMYYFMSENENTTMKCFDIAQGIQITYSNLNTDSCFAPVIPEKDYLQIDFCINGCYEFEHRNGLKYFFGERDLCITPLRKGKQIFVSSAIPFNKYCGITILMEMETAQKTLEKDFKQAKINLYDIRSTLCKDDTPIMIKSTHETDHIFGELCSVDKRIQTPYFWIKVIEILLFLSIKDVSNILIPQQFSKEVTEATKHVYNYIIDNPFSKETISTLSTTFLISESSLKRCFKSMSGESIGTFMKVKRIESVAELIESDTKLSIGEISEIAGYENQSKFSAAFKSIFGVTPITYRHKSERTDWSKKIPNR